MTIILTITLATVIAALIYDLKEGRIPNWITLPAMSAGITYHFCSTGIQGLGFSAAGLIVGFSLFLVFYIMGGMGAGDIKLMGALGALLGPGDILLAASFTAIAGGIYASALLLQRDNRKTLIVYKAWIKGIAVTKHFTHIQETAQTIPLRYGIAIAAGTMAFVMQKIVFN